jgi:hypothetical protein
MKPRVLILALPGLLAAVLAGCGSSLIGSASTSTPSSAATTPVTAAAVAPLSGEVAVAFPVVACTTASGGQLPSQGWRPTILLAPVPTALVGKVEFYSDGFHTLLGPDGWSCSQSQGSQGATGLVVYPPSEANPPVSVIPAPGTEGVFAIFDNTGHAQGISLVCPFFTVPSWQQREAGCSGNKPAGEQTSMPTPDVAAVTDPAGVTGHLEGSGGPQAVSGTVIFPQVVPAVTNGYPVDVAVESCSLTDTALCPTILSDFQVREFPVPTASQR